ncbi:MAG: insulinase family protein [Chloroflexi bacterium]|nr:insulinase family protein [Chloroflexota bacterium]
MYDKTVLDNGLRIVSSSMPHTRSVSISLFVGAGSRYEADPIAGVSHFLEHMLFKGTEKRPTPQEVSEEIEGVGGTMNAGTDKELTVYWAKVGDQHFDRAMDLLVDNLLHSKLEPEEIEKERAVITEELGMVEDSPGDLVNVLIDEILWPDQPLGRDAGGTKESVAAITRQDIVSYMGRHYVPENTILAVAGNVTHERVVESARQLLGDWSRAPFGAWYPVVDGHEWPRVGLRSKRTEQAHVCLATPGVSSVDPDRFAADVLNCVLGEGMSSRLFLEIREHLSLAYDVHSYVQHFLDTGAVVVGAGVDPRRLDQAIQAILVELEKVQRQEVPERELVKAKEFIKGRLQLRMEDTRAVSSWLGSQELLRREILTVDEVLSSIDRVTAEHVQRMAERLFAPGRFSLAIVGPYKDEARFRRLLTA